MCTYHTQVDWREGLWHWQIIERVQHVVQVIFLGERHKKKERKRHGTTAEVFFVSVVDAAILTTVQGQKLLETRGQTCSKTRSPSKHPTDICFTIDGEVKRRLGGLDLQLCAVIKGAPHSMTQTLISHLRTGLTIAGREGD